MDTTVEIFAPGTYPCDGADLDRDEDVDMEDLEQLAPLLFAQ